jgi:hypothetical protein
VGEYPVCNSSGDYLVFIPPADDVKPIPVPVEVYTQCITDASRFFGIDAELVFTLFDNEGGKVGTFSRNKNGTYDIGPMQINSSNLPEIRGHFPSVTWRVLAYDACASFWVGTWWLYRKIVDRNGNVFEGIADYNSKTLRSGRGISLTSWSNTIAGFRAGMAWTSYISGRNQRPSTTDIL